MNLSAAPKFTKRYILALSLVAGLTIFGQVLVQQQLSSQISDSYLVNYAGKQRFQSQLIVKNALLLTNAHELKSGAAVRAELLPVLARWERYHRELKSGNLSDLHILRPNSARVRQLFGQIEPHFQVIQQHIHRLLTLTVQANPPHTAILYSLQQILAHEQTFLLTMNAIVRQYAYEAQTKVERLQGIEQVLMVITLFVLLLEALLIFYPGVQMLQLMVKQLTDSERKTRKVNEALRESNQSLQQAQIQLLQEATLRHKHRLNEQRIRLSSVIQGQEDERKRLSRELHDGIGQMLTGLKLLSENIRSAALLSDKDQTTFASLKTLLVRTIQETRHVSNNLMPPVLGDFGLLPALRQLIEQQDRQAAVSIFLHSSLTNQRFGQPVEIGLYRIVQEAVNNALKHAGANRIDVSLEQRQDRLFLRITDDGCGISTDRKPHGSHGLHNMRERARLLDGTFRVTARAGNARPSLARLNAVSVGTRVLVSIPVAAHPIHNVATPAAVTAEH